MTFSPFLVIIIQYKLYKSEQTAKLLADCTDVQASLSYICDWYFSMYASLFVCHPSDQNLNLV